MSTTKPLPNFGANGNAPAKPTQTPGVDFFTANQAGTMVIDFARERAAQKNDVITLGIDHLDRDSLPIYPGQFGVIVGAKHNGKSLLARHIVKHNARMLLTQGRVNDAVVYVHCEENAVRARVWTMETPPSMFKIARGEADEGDLMAKVANASYDPIYFIGRSGVKTGTYAQRKGHMGVSSARIDEFLRWADDHGVNVRLIVVDYLQKMHANNEKGIRSESDRIAMISDELLEMAEASNSAVIVAAQADIKQLKRMPAKERMPQLEHIWYSARIAHNVDFGFGIQKPSQDHIDEDEVNGVTYTVERTHFKIECLAWRECGVAGNQYLLDSGGGDTGRPFGALKQVDQYDPKTAKAARSGATGAPTTRPAPKTQPTPAFQTQAATPQPSPTTSALPF